MFIDDRRGRSGGSVRRWTLRVLLVGLLAVGVLVAVTWWYTGSRLTPIDVEALAAEPDGDGDDDGGGGARGLTNTLVVVTAEEGDETSLDSVVLVQTGRTGAPPVAVLFPPELLVTSPGEGSVRLSEVHRSGGADGMVRSVQDFTGVDLDHYVESDLAGAGVLAGALGSVEVCTEPDAEDGGEGCDVVDGAGAEQLAVADGTEDAFARLDQRAGLLRGLAEEARRVGTMANPLEMKRLVDGLAAHVQTDHDLGLLGLRSLATDLAGSEPADVRTVPATLQTIDGQTHAVAAPEQATAMFDALATGDALDADLGTEVAEALAPDGVDVLVVNGVGISGLAGNVRDYLEARSFRVLDAVNPSDLDPDAEFDTTLQRMAIRHTEATRPHAEVLRDHLGDVPVDLEVVGELPNDAHVVLVVGGAWDAG